MVFWGESILVLHFKQFICLFPFFTGVFYSFTEILFHNAWYSSKKDHLMLLKQSRELITKDYSSHHFYSSCDSGMFTL